MLLLFPAHRSLSAPVQSGTLSCSDTEQQASPGSPHSVSPLAADGLRDRMRTGLGVIPQPCPLRAFSTQYVS
ncbi:Serine beta-lactamase-like protein LACTB mitochondrial [Dissostichus eleginoides]|uniref:Serine beta-lactamase-like protein LACTB mitochondrial n=2 Tax=Notothenioidei TaxID=8205 RepID=A0AAD9FF45_DISEL|nr:hypothetical protein KUCAC02_013163 [Chaenocephalus aceratus]KAK1898986.1 Serine beta-lactamase-like protein LACTB mitochondrial [Dissostichus eleginoides]